MTLRPFWRYFGGKWRAAPRYPAPRYGTIIEPFAGAAGYSLRYPDRRVILVEKYPVVAGIWRYLIATPAAELMRIPTVDHVDDLPAWVPQEARWLVGMRLAAGDTRPRAKLSPMVRRDGGYGAAEIANQVEHIRHWHVIEGDYTAAPDEEATWFVDSPYQVAGSRAARSERGRVRYPHGGDALDFDALGAWCGARRGQAIVCENVGATWLPFRPLGSWSSVGDRVSREAVWLSDADLEPSEAPGDPQQPPREA